jgi:hypothetical protein
MNKRSNENLNQKQDECRKEIPFIKNDRVAHKQRLIIIEEILNA